MLAFCWNVKLLFFVFCIISTSKTVQLKVKPKRNLNCSNDSEFRCETNFKCINKQQVCDGYQDCADKSDETKCTC